MINSDTIGSRKETLLILAFSYIILVSLGFPGKLADVYGRFLETFAEYSSFGLQILLMCLGGGKGSQNVLEIQLLNLQARYQYVYLMLAAFFGFSMLVTLYPQEQVISCMRFSVTALFALWAVDQYQTKQILNAIIFAQALFVLVALYFTLAYPALAFSSESGGSDFTGFLETKNNAAAELSCLILLQLVLLKAKVGKEKVSRGFILLLAVQIALLFLCNATGARIQLLIPAVYLLLMDRKKAKGFRVHPGVIYIVGSVGFIIFALTILPYFESLFEFLGKDVTLTGRVPLWRQVIKVMSEDHTFLGYGYGMFWRNSSAVALLHTAFYSNSFRGSMLTGAHNVLLELWLNVGLVGIFFFFLVLLLSMNTFRWMEALEYHFCAMYIIWFMLFGLTERAFTTYKYDILFLFLVIGTGFKIKRPQSFGQRRKRANVGLQVH